MLTKPTVAALRAVYSLSKHAAWDDIDKMFEAELADTLKSLAMARDEVTIRQLQGRAQFIQEFQALVREAHERLLKLRESTL